MYYGEQEVLRENIKTPDEIIKDIQSVTAEEIKFVAERIFKNEGLNLSVVGKFESDKEFMEVLHF
jgi:predicted Zn-dependent peptidase